MNDRLLILDLGGSACYAAAHILRTDHLFCTIVKPEAFRAEMAQGGIKGILLPLPAEGKRVDIPGLPQILSAGLPVLALGDAALPVLTCFGGSAARSDEAAGVRALTFVGQDAILNGLDDGERYIPVSFICQLPQGAAEATAVQSDGGVIGYRISGKDVYGFSFLPDQNDPDSILVMQNFCRDICLADPWWSAQTITAEARKSIEAAAEGGEAVCCISGGVDSAVCAVLGNMALGHRLHCVFFDNGLLRKDESRRVVSLFRDELGLNLTRIDIAGDVLPRLAGITDPAAKEAIVYDCYQAQLVSYLQANPAVKLLIRGTNYNDVLGSEDDEAQDAGTGIAAVEPVRLLFKDEIRRLAETLNLPQQIINRQPFPGSGLALRMIGSVDVPRLAILREADSILREEIELAGLQKKLWQYFVTMAVDPMIDGGGSYIILLRAVQVSEGIGAVASRLPYDLLERIVQRILACDPAVSRVLYDMTPSKSYKQA